MTKPFLYLLGASGHGKVVADCALSQGRWREAVFFDDRWPELTHCGRHTVVGTSQEMLASCSRSGEVFVAIGRSQTRMHWLTQFENAGFVVATLIHRRATVSDDAQLGCGTLVVAGAVINPGAILGRGCIINTGATIDHDCQLAEGVHACPGAHLAGDVVVGARSWLGIGCSIREGVIIGADVTVGAGAAVVSDLPDQVTALGVPARPFKINS